MRRTAAIVLALGLSGCLPDPSLPAPQVHIEPADPTTSEDLALVVEELPTGEGAVALTLGVSWTADGATVAELAGQRSVEASRTEVGQVWAASTWYELDGDVGPAAGASVTIGGGGDDDDVAPDDDDIGSDDDDVAPDDDDIGPDDDDIAPDDDDIGPDDDDVAPDDDDIAPDDADGDGWTVDLDCDDSDPSVNPDQEEVCDGIDNDCDDEIGPTSAIGSSVIDEDFDGDLDGWSTCGPDGIADTGDEDCNDGLASVNPGEIEVCDDGTDNDCNGGVDDGCGVDSDGDGVTLEGPDGVLGTADDDCDDNEASVHPGAPEVLDHLDNDCDGIANEEVVTVHSVVITEILKDVDGADDCGEFFELYNNSGVDLALTGWTVEDSDPDCTGSGDTFTLPELVIPTDDYVILARSGDSFCNNALELAEAVIYPDTWVLANNEDEIYLCADAFMVDAIEYDETSFPSPTGASFGLDPAAGFAVDNNDGAIWCVQTTPFPAGAAFGIDEATPGEANDPC